MGAAERFAKWRAANKSKVGIRRLLWHGSDSETFARILRKGLRLPSASYGCSGIYFADMSSKSARYCCKTTPEEASFMMLLCEVELGNNQSSSPAIQTPASASNPVSVLVSGKTTHKKWCDAKLVSSDLEGVRMPDVESGTASQDKTAAYYYREYIVYDAAQIRLRYLFHFTM